MAQATPVTGTFSLAGTSDHIRATRKRRNTAAELNVTIFDAGSFDGTIQIQRRFVGDSTWHVVKSYDGLTELPVAEIVREPELDVDYRYECTVRTAGSATYRLSQ